MKTASDKLIMFTGIERAKFRRPVVPGDQLRIEVELKNWRARPSMIAVRMEGIVYVGAKRVAEAIVSCQLVDSARGRASSEWRRRQRSGRAGIIAPVWRNIAGNQSTAQLIRNAKSSSRHPSHRHHRSAARRFIPPARSAPIA